MMTGANMKTRSRRKIILKAREYGYHRWYRPSTWLGH